MINKYLFYNAAAKVIKNSERSRNTYPFLSPRQVLLYIINVAKQNLHTVGEHGLYYYKNIYPQLGEMSGKKLICLAKLNRGCENIRDYITIKHVKNR